MTTEVNMDANVAAKMQKYFIQKDGDEFFFSFELVSKLIKEHDLNGTQVTIYLAIADYILTNNENAISLEYLSAATGVNKSTVFHNAGILVEKGVIKRWIPEKTNKRRTRYDFRWIK